MRRSEGVCRIPVCHGDDGLVVGGEIRGVGHCFLAERVNCGNEGVLGGL